MRALACPGYRRLQLANRTLAPALGMHGGGALRPPATLRGGRSGHQPVQLLEWWPSWGEGWLVYAGMLLVWSLALYVLTRGRGLIPRLAVLAMATFSAYLLGLWAGALAFPAEPDGWVVWLRGTWWTTTFAPAFWVLLTLQLTVDEGTRSQQSFALRLLPALAPTVLGLAGLLAGIGMLTEFVVQWSGAYAGTPEWVIGEDLVYWHIPAGPLYPIYEAYLLACLMSCVAMAAWLTSASPAHTPLRARFEGVMASAILFLVGGTYLAVVGGNFGFQSLPGEVVLIAGMIVMGWNIARYGALLSGEVVAADFRAFAVSTLAVVLLYVGLILLVPREFSWPLGERLLVLVVMTTHLLAERSSAILDRFVFASHAESLRRQLRSVADRVVRQPDSLTALADVREVVNHAFDGPLGDSLLESSAPTELRLLVEGALRHINDMPALSRHRLIGRTASTVDSHRPAVENAALVRADLVEAVERLRPTSPRPTPGTSTGPGGWLHYLVLHEAYIEGRPNKQIMQRYYLSESTFHRARRRAVDTVALDIYQRTGPQATLLSTP